MYRAHVRAMQAWYDAEPQRGHDDSGTAPAWQRTAQACADAGLPWDEAYATWRVAEALTKDRAARDRATTAPRRAHALAIDLRATPLLAEVEALARNTRISLVAIADSPQAASEALPGAHSSRARGPGSPGGRPTYGEIARELVLSEKTVSVHV